MVSGMEMFSKLVICSHVRDIQQYITSCISEKFSLKAAVPNVL